MDMDMGDCAPSSSASSALQRWRGPGNNQPGALSPAESEHNLPNRHGARHQHPASLGPLEYWPHVPPPPPRAGDAPI